MKNLLKMNLQRFAEPDIGNGTGEPAPAVNQNQNSAPPAIDYEKIASLITGKQTVTEDTVLKSYFKQQGLSGDEMQKAIDTFKAEKAKNTPDPFQIQAELANAKAQAKQAIMEQKATMVAIGLGLDVKTIPYVLKMADLSAAETDEAITNALNKVLEDIPQLKPQLENNSGFLQVGSSGGNGNGTKTDNDALKKAFGLLERR